MKEQVLVAKTKIKNGIYGLEEIFNSLSILSFIEKEKAEKDKKYIQLVIYVLLKKDNKLYGYYRESGEKRLKGNFSVGWGGHINEKDCVNKQIRTSIINCTNRELTEELGFVPRTIGFVKAIYTNKNPVSKMHLGFVGIADITNEEEKKLLKNKKVCLYTNQKNLEEWSKIAINGCLQC